MPVDRIAAINGIVRYCQDANMEKKYCYTSGSVRKFNRLRVLLIGECSGQVSQSELCISCLGDVRRIMYSKFMHTPSYTQLTWLPIILINLERVVIRLTKSFLDSTNHRLVHFCNGEIREAIT